MADPSSTSATSDPVPPEPPVSGSPTASPGAPEDPSAAPAPGDSRNDSSILPTTDGSQGSDPEGTVISKPRPLAPVISTNAGSPIEMGAALEGETLGHFHLEKFVGGGGMGAVFRATDGMLDRTVAVKVLSRGHSEHELVRRFKNEAQSAARLDHENIARVYYVGEDKGWNYIVFEYIEGLNIRQMVAQRGPLPLGEAISYTLQVAEAIEHASRRDVVHRDIKPSNVLITTDGHVKLVDMGLARLHQVETPERDITASGVTLGTFDYISPEQARDPRSADVRSDLYSLGCTLYFMLTGHAPFPEGTVLQKLLSHTSDERPDPRTKRPDLPDEIIEILDRMLARQPQDRYQRPSELIGELLLMADQLGLHDAGRGTVWISADRERPRWIEFVVPTVIPLFCLMIVIFTLDRFWPSPDTRLTVPRPNLLPAYAENSAQPMDTAPVAEQTDRQPPPGSFSAEDANPSEASVAGATDTSEGTAADQESSSTDQGIARDSTESSEDLELQADVGPPDVTGELSVVEPGDEEPADLQPEEVTIEQISPADLVEVDESDTSSNPDTEVIERIIVGRADPVPRRSLVVDSLDSAIQQASDLSGASIIELWFDGPQSLDPLVIAAEDLTIAAGDGYSPELVFIPQEREFATDGQMIQLHGGRIVLEGLHFWFSPFAESDNWSLFNLDQIATLELRDCSMTIVNNNATPPGLYDERVAFFKIEQPPRVETMGSDWESTIDEPFIKMERCIARGQATLISAERATPVRLSWLQGLFVTSQRLVEMEGAIYEPEWFSEISIELQNVTAVMPRGMCRLAARVDAAYQIYLDLYCSNCILIPGSDSALIEHDEVQLLDDESLERHMEIRGQFCFFPDRSIVWRFVPLTEQDAAFEYRLGSTGKWFDLKRPDRIQDSMWRRVPDLSRLPHLQTSADFELDPSPENPALRQTETAGFETLPSLPRDGQIPAIMTADSSADSAALFDEPR